MLPLARRAALSLAALAVASAPMAARALTCTVSPTATFTLGPLQPAPDFAKEFMLNAGYAPTIAFTIGATPEPGASCDNMTRGASYTISHTGHDDTAAQNFGGDADDAGSISVGNLPTGTYTAKVTLSCRCGLLGGPSQTIEVGPLVVPPSLQNKVQVFTKDDSKAVAIDAVPVGKDLLITTAATAHICTGESQTLTLKGAGLDETTSADGNADCKSGDVGAAFNVKATSKGALTLAAHYAGLTSNEVTLTVVDAPAVTPDPGSTDEGSSDTKSGCQSVAAFGVLPLLAAGLLARRRAVRA